MDSSGKFSYSFRRYPLLRAFIGVFVILVVLGSVFLFNYRTKPVPVIYSIIGKRYSGKTELSKILTCNTGIFHFDFNDFLNEKDIKKRKDDYEYVI